MAEREFTLTKSLRRRFGAKFEKTAGCWEWNGGRTKKGYGQIGSGGRRGSVLYAHRVSYFIHAGEVPEGLDVCHSCDNPCCVNPDHLFAGTRLENMQDAVKKGRMPSGEQHYLRKRPGLRRGSGNNNSKLDEKKVRQILKRLQAGETQESLAGEFSVASTTINRIASRKLWPHVEV